MELKDNIPLYNNSDFVPPFQTGDIEGKPDGPYRQYVINQAIKNDLTCARDHKWKLIGDTIKRQECDGVSQMYIMAAVYRFWQCTAKSTLDDLGLGSVQTVNLGTGVTDLGKTNFRGGRDFWFDRVHLDKQFALDLDETLEGFGLM